MVLGYLSQETVVTSTSYGLRFMRLWCNQKSMAELWLPELQTQYKSDVTDKNGLRGSDWAIAYIVVSDI